MKKVLFKRLLVLIGFVQLALEFNSQWLFLWPINHYCALPNNLTQRHHPHQQQQQTTSSYSLIIDSTDTRSGEDDGRENDEDTASFVQAYLFNANSEDPLTAAKAQAMGFNYDDIPHCLAHPFELGIANSPDNATTINWGSLEPCQFGLNFNELEASLSIIGHFELACSRQWIKILLPQSIGLGLLLGVLQVSRWQLGGFFRWTRLDLVEADSIADEATNDQPECSANGRSRCWIVWHLLTLLVVYYSANELVESYATLAARDQLAKRQGNYFHLLTCVLLRSLGIASILLRLLQTSSEASDQTTTMDTREDFSLSPSWSLRENNSYYFVALSVVHVVFEALYSPLALRLFDNWSSLNVWLTNSLVIYSFSVVFYELFAYKHAQLEQLCDNSLRKLKVCLSPTTAGSSTSQRKWPSSAFLLSKLSKRREANVLIEDHDVDYDDKGDESNVTCEQQENESAMIEKQKARELNLLDDERAATSALVAIKRVFAAAGSSSFQQQLPETNGSTVRQSSSVPLPLQAALVCTRPPLTRKVCEFCLTKGQTIYAVGMNHPPLAHHRRQQQQQQQQLEQSVQFNGQPKLGGAADDESSAAVSIALPSSTAPTSPIRLACSDFDACYQPTTVQIGYFSSAKEPEGGAPAVNHRRQLACSAGADYLHASRDELPTAATSRPPSSLASAGHKAFYDGRLFSWPVLGQLRLLTFCLSLNYFLFRMIPNHKLTHSESIESQRSRKQSYQREHSLEAAAAATSLADRLSVFVWSSDLSLNSSKRVRPSITGATAANTSVDGDDMFAVGGHANNDNATTSTKTGSAHRKLFDYRSINYAINAIESMRNSSNPLWAIWTSAQLNDWPSELLVLTLHLSPRLYKFKAIYFKANRLLWLVKLGSQLLMVEWLTIALLRRQNHLLESSWLQALASLIARFSSTLMLFNYFDTLLSLSTKLDTNRLIKLVPSVTCALIAFLLASFAPILEKLDLVIIPLLLLLNNSLVCLMLKNLSGTFEDSLCPMLFENDNHDGPHSYREGRGVVRIDAFG